MAHISLDIETLGNKPGSVIASIGACEFNLNGIPRTFYITIDVASSLMAGLVVEQATVDWWRSQPYAAREATFFNGMKYSLQSALQMFAQFIHQDDTIWAKGPDFDCVLLEAAYKAIGAPVPWRFRNTRDLRTLIYMANVEAVKPDLAHTALSDAVAQAKTVINGHKRLNIPLP